MRAMYGATDDANKSLAITSQQAQQLVPQLNDVASSLLGGAGAFQVLVQQGPQISQIFGGYSSTLRTLAGAIGPVRLGVIAAGAALGGFVAIAESGDAAIRNLQNRLRSTRDDYASLASTVDNAARAVAASSSISTGDARTAGRTIAATPQFSGSQAGLEAMVRLSADVAKGLGIDIPAAAEKLAQALKSPAQAAQELADGGFKTMNEELLRSVERLENQGKKAEASRLVLDAYNRALAGAAQNVSPFEAATTRLLDKFQAGFDNLRGPATWLANFFADILQKVEDLDRFAQDNPVAKFFNFGPAATGTPAGGSLGDAVREPTTADRINSADKLVRTINPDSRQRQDIADQTRQLTDALALPGLDPSKATAYRDALASLREQLDGLKDPASKVVEGLQKQAALANVAEGAAREYAQAEQAVAEAHGGAAAQAAARSAIEQKLSGDMSAHLNQTSAQIRGQQALAEAYDKGGDAVMRAEAATRAEADALRYTVEGTKAYDLAVAGLTGRYIKLAQWQAAARSAQAERTQRNSLETLQKEAELVGATEATRTRELALLRERQALEAEGIKPEEDRYQRRLRNAAAIADQTTALARQKDAWSEIQNIGTQAFDRIGAAVSEAFTQGKAGAISFGSVAKAVLSEVLQAVVKLAILRPVMNAALGTNYGTLFDAGGAIGTATAGGASGSASSSGGAGLGDYASLASSAYKLGGFGGAGGSIGATINEWGASSGLFSNAGAAQFQALPAGVAGPVLPASAATPGAFGNLTATQALGGVAGVAGGAYGIYSGVQRGGVGGYTTAAGGALGVAAGAATLAPAMFGSLAALGPYGLIAAAVIMAIGSFLPGAKPSNRTGTAALDIASGGVNVYGQTGDKFSAENRAAASQLAGGFGKLADSLQKLTGVRPGGRLTVDVGDRDGIGFAYANPAKGLALSGKFSNDEAGAKEASRSAAMLMVQSIYSELPDAIQRAWQGVSMDTAESILTGLAQIAEATNGGKPTASQAIAATHIDFTDLNAGLGELKWVRDVYEALTSAAKPVGAFDQSLAALNASWQDTIDHAARLGLATDALSASWAEAAAKAWEDRNAAVNSATDALHIRLARARGGSGEAADLFEFDAQAREQRRSYAAQFEAWGLNAEETATRLALLEETLGAERLAISKSYADKITEQTKQATDQAAQAAGGVVTSLRDYARGLRTSDASPLSAAAQYEGSSREFNAVLGAAAAGDSNSIARLSSYADTLLKTSRAMFGSGTQYAADYQRVVDAVGTVAAQSADQLTASFYAAQVAEQTTTLNGSLLDLRAEVAALRREIALNAARPAA